MGSIEQALHALTILSPLSDDLFEKLTSASSVRLVTAGTLLFRKGDPGTSIFGVVQGSILAESESPDGQELYHRLVGPGEILGEIAVLDGGLRTSSARVVEPSELVEIDGTVFLEVLERDGRLGRRVATLIATRIRSTSSLLEDTVFLRARDRIAKKLLELSEPTRDGYVLRRIGHETLARMVGLKTRVSVTQQLSLLEQSGLLRRHSDHWVLPDPARLEALCNGTDIAQGD